MTDVLQYMFAVNVSLQMQFDWSIKNMRNLLVATEKVFNFSKFKIFLLVTQTRQVTSRFKLLFEKGSKKSGGVTLA